MPVSRASTKKKEDATQKLKEIKLRQQNWLKQREQSKGREESRPKVASAPSSSKSKEASRFSLTTKPANVPDRQEPHIQTRFKNWINARENGVPSKADAAFDDNLSIRSGVESELARLVTPEVTHEQPVAEEEFGDLAEKIASKVRSDLGLSHSQRTTARTESTEISEVESEHLTWRNEKCKTFTQDNSFGSSGLTSHNCPICRKVMLSSRNLPMMVIPCGHTLCKACSERRQTCPACDCNIVSLTVNIMLQQIIHEFHSHPNPAHHSPHRTMAESKQAGAVGETQVRQDYVEDNRRNRMASYTSQLANLQTRHEILSSERASLIDKQRQLSTQLRQNHTQVASVKKQEVEVQKAILDLHERLSALQQHKEQYETQTVELTDEKSKVDGKVSLLATTITSLAREIEKVALLAENEN